MIDIHSHILHGVDDGSRDINLAIRLCELTKNSGFNKIIATPHFSKDKSEEYSKKVKNNFKELKDRLLTNKCGVDIFLGMELEADLELVNLLKDKIALTLNETSYILVEFPRDSVPVFADELFNNLIKSGYKVILAHPERNKQLMDGIEEVGRYVDKGIYIQIDKGSLRGDFGKYPCNASESLLNQGLVHFVATNSHGISYRNPMVDGLRNKIKDYVGEENVWKIIDKNPMNLLENKDIEIIKIQKKQKIFNFSNVFNIFEKKSFIRK